VRNAIFYLTYNGLYNFTNGIGTQTQLLISGLEAIREALMRRMGPSMCMWSAPYPMRTPGVMIMPSFSGSSNVLRRSVGKYISFPTSATLSKTLGAPFLGGLCQNVAPLLHTQTAAYDRSLIIGVDQPWLQTTYALGMGKGQVSPHHIDMLLVLYSTAFIRNWETLTRQRLPGNRKGSRRPSLVRV